VPGARVAVVIPCLDAGPPLRAAVDSALRGPDAEVVVVDDGSTEPRTLEVMRELEREGVPVLHQPNRGPAAARNAGVAATTAPYVLPLDADDELKPGTATALADELDRDPQLALVWGLVELAGRRDPLVPAAQLDAWLLTHLNQVPNCTLLRRNLLEHVGGWRSGIDFEDWDLWLRCALAGARGRRIDVVTHRYHLGETGRFATASREYGAAVARFRAANAEAMRARPRLWRRSEAHPVTRAVLPVLAKVPFAARRRDRLADWVDALVTRRASLADLAWTARRLATGPGPALLAVGSVV
jgi:glycosyltransferase involved in cell wall biosynthesis